MKISLPVLAIALSLAAAGPAYAACQGTEILYQDSFDRLQPTWGDAGDSLKVENSQLLVAPLAEAYFWRINSANLYDDIDLCVTMTTTAGIDPVESKAGLVFWYLDVNNFYVFQLAPNGKASVFRRQRGKWLEQVGWRDAAGANPGDGAINELQVRTVGSQATFFVNGTEFEELSGSPPDIGQQVGVFAASPASGAASFAFDNFKVTKP